MYIYIALFCCWSCSSHNQLNILGEDLLRNLNDKGYAELAKEIKENSKFKIDKDYNFKDAFKYDFLRDDPCLQILIDEDFSKVESVDLFRCDRSSYKLFEEEFLRQRSLELYVYKYLQHHRIVKVLIDYKVFFIKEK